MSWLAAAAPSPAVSRAVLGLLPEAACRLGELVETAWTVTDPRLLAPAAAAVAETFGAPAAPSPADERERAAVAYAEQFAFDPSAVHGRLDAELRAQLGPTGLADFVAALNVVEGYLRACALLELELELELSPPAIRPPRPPAPSREVEFGKPPLGDGNALRDYRNRLIDPRLVAARSAYARAVLGLHGVEEVTTEVVRLRNAQFQQCEY